MDIATGSDVILDVLANQSDIIHQLESVNANLTILCTFLLFIIFLAITNWFFKFVNGLMS